MTTKTGHFVPKTIKYGDLIINKKHTTKEKHMSVKLLNAVVDIFKVGDDKETIIIRGVVDPECLKEIKVASYQREVVPGARVKDLKIALRNSTVPDIELGMRGEKYRVHESENGDTFYLQDDVFVIDGLQRKSAGQSLISEDPTAKPRIGALVHINTDEEWEAERFRILNQERLKLNSNILLRNSRSRSPAVDMIFRLTQDDSFALCNRVQWSQRKARMELLTALILCQTAGFLHSRFGPGRGKDINMISGLDTTMVKVGRTTMRDNVKTFFEVLEECFGIRRIIYSHSATVIRRTFLVVVADLFTHHSIFWQGYRLVVDKRMKEKIAKFPINDPEVVRLASSGGKAKDILYQLFLEHVNSGKRKFRLTEADSRPKETSDDSENGNASEVSGQPTNEQVAKRTLDRMGL